MVWTRYPNPGCQTLESMFSVTVRTRLSLFWVECLFLHREMVLVDGSGFRQMLGIHLSNHHPLTTCLPGIVLGPEGTTMDKTNKDYLWCSHQCVCMCVRVWVCVQQ